MLLTRYSIGTAVVLLGKLIAKPMTGTLPPTSSGSSGYISSNPRWGGRWSRINGPAGLSGASVLRNLPGFRQTKCESRKRELHVNQRLCCSLLRQEWHFPHCSTATRRLTSYLGWDMSSAGLSFTCSNHRSRHSPPGRREPDRPWPLGFSFASRFSVAGGGAGLEGGAPYWRGPCAVGASSGRRAFFIFAGN